MGGERVLQRRVTPAEERTERCMAVCQIGVDTVLHPVAQRGSCNIKSDYMIALYVGNRGFDRGVWTEVYIYCGKRVSCTPQPQWSGRR